MTFHRKTCPAFCIRRPVVPRVEADDADRTVRYAARSVPSVVRP